MSSVIRINYNLPWRRCEVYIVLGTDKGESWTLADILNGFWADKFYQPTKGSDNKHYILPHMIEAVIKLSTKEYAEVIKNGKHGRERPDDFSEDSEMEGRAFANL